MPTTAASIAQSIGRPLCIGPLLDLLLLSLLLPLLLLLLLPWNCYRMGGHPKAIRSLGALEDPLEPSKVLKGLIRAAPRMGEVDFLLLKEQAC